MFGPLVNSIGLIECIGHQIDPRTLRCTVSRYVDGEKTTCNRHIFDILSEFPSLTEGAPGVACTGNMNLSEMETGRRCYEAMRAALG